jgi:hypothetical protein
LLLLALCAAAHAFLAASAQADPSVSEGEFADVAGEHALFAAEDPRTIFARARAWPVHGTPFPDALLREAVETALRPEAPWDQVTAAITAFDLYQDRPWVTQVLQPFVAYHATNILLNVDVFAKLHRGWTKRAVAMATPQAPGFVLSALKTLSALDPVWAKQLATTAAATMPAAVWPHVDDLLAVDVQWVEGILRDAAKVAPYDAIRAVRSYITAPWGQRFFAEVVLREPRGVVSVVTANAEQYQAVRQALATATHPALPALAKLIDSSYPPEGSKFSART